MIAIEDVTARTESTVTISFTGAPEVKARYLDRFFLPGYLRAQYKYVLAAGSGRWVCYRVMTSGRRILKPGPDGAQRLGKDTHDRDWSTSFNRPSCLSDDDTVDEWVRKLVNELRPSGDVAEVGI